MIGPHTDIYQLGVVLYKLMVGRDPVAGKDMGELVDAILHGRIVAPSQVIGNFPRPVEGVLLKAMATKPEQRFASARQLAQALQGMLPEEFGDGREPIASFLRRVAGERYQKQARFVAQIAGRGGEPADLDELFRRPSEDEVAAELPVEASAVMPDDGSLPKGLDSSDELPWASAILMIDPKTLQMTSVGSETPASVDDLVNPPELGLMERLMPQVAKGRFILLPITPQTRGHGTHSLPAGRRTLRQPRTPCSRRR